MEVFKSAGRVPFERHSLYELTRRSMTRFASATPVSTAAALSGTTYFVMIVMAQVLGATCQLGLMRRLRWRRLLSRREMIILLIALGIEVTRMLAVDLFMLRDYFSGRQYKVYAVPPEATPEALAAVSASDASASMCGATAARSAS